MMIKKRITLPDGRYLIYYNFEDERAKEDKKESAPKEKSQRSDKDRNLKEIS